MRLALIVSLAVHGAAAAALALFGVARAPAEPTRVVEVGLRDDALPEVERLRDPPPVVPEDPFASEAPEFPEEAPEPEPIEAPREEPTTGFGQGLPTRNVRLSTPLRRPVRARAPARPPIAPPVAARAAPKGELRPPRLRDDLSPAAQYPARSRRMGHEGTVVLLIGVAADGAVARVEIATSSGHEELDRAAADAAKLWRFEPARRDGEALAYDVRVPVEFRLTDA